MKSKIFLLVFIAAFAVNYFSCNKIKPDPKVPCYIHIDSISLTTVYADHGSNSHRTTDAWVTVDGKSIGAFEIPCTVPLLVEEGAHDVRVDAGIWVNGISATRNQYHFYTSYNASVNLEKEKIITVTPVINYADYTQFIWKEDFEGNSYSLEKTSRCDASINISKSTGSNAFEGSGSGHFALNPSQVNFEFQTYNEYPLPKDDRDIFLELNFKTNIELTVGLYTKTLSSIYREQIVTLNPTSEWKKVYIYLTSIAQLHADAGGHRIFFAATNSGNDAEIFLDNIKLVY